MKRAIRREELRQIVPLADSTVYDLEQRGDFPRRFYLTPRTPAWDFDEVQEWLKKRKDAGTTLQEAKHRPDVKQRKTRPVRSLRVVG
ncbi:MAG: AlpA family transcriptional regulator [Zoogloeaceae bacterium]|jgi:prophage regulatory protein|nr:AlpA family transcriptional regulator [Zoogloeaceae bacterium]